MAELAARSAGADLFPIEAGGIRAVERVPEALWSVMPLGGGARPAWWPEPGRVVAREGVRAVWFGREAAMVEGPRPESGAVVEQTDAWVVVRLEGQGVEDVLARLVPLDLRERAFPEASVARTLLGHLNVAVIRDGAGFEVWAFRSMAGTLAHELGRAMRGVAARAG